MCQIIQTVVGDSAESPFKELFVKHCDPRFDSSRVPTWALRGRHLLFAAAVSIPGCSGSSAAETVQDAPVETDAGDGLPQCSTDGFLPNTEIDTLVIFPESTTSYDGDGVVVRVAQRGRTARLQLDGLDYQLEVYIGGELFRDFVVGERFGVNLRTDGVGDVEGILFLSDPQGELILASFNYWMNELSGDFFTERFPLPVTTHPTCVGEASCYTSPPLRAAATIQTPTEQLLLQSEVTYETEVSGAPFKVVSYGGAYIQGEPTGECTHVVPGDNFALKAIRANLND